MADAVKDMDSKALREAFLPSEKKEKAALHDLELAGKKLRIRSDEPQDKLEEAAAYVDELLLKSFPKEGGMAFSTPQLLVVALQLANEVLGLKEKERQAVHQLKHTSLALLGRLNGREGEAEAEQA